MTTLSEAMTHYTDEQAQALTSSEPTIALEAGAGCGKTFVLTERLLAQLDPTESADRRGAVDEVVAITFTDAAAREMRDRVRHKCFQRLQSADETARKQWLGLLRSLDTARVSTIHSFCGNLLRSHALPIGLDPSFTVLDQASADVLLSEAIDNHLREGLDGQQEVVLQLAAEFNITGLKQRLLSLLEVAPASRTAWLDKSADEVVARWRETHAQIWATVLAKVRETAQFEEIVRLLHSTVNSTDKFSAYRDWLLEAVPRLQQGEVAVELLDELDARLTFKGNQSKRWASDEEYQHYKQTVAQLKQSLSDKPPALAAEDQLHRAAELGLALLRESVGVAELYEQMKRSTVALDYDDLLSKTHALLTDPQHAEVQQAVRRGIRLLLVDEFQDTDRLQAEIVRALVGLHEAKSEGGSLFFVGDFKQSIYRFRGAEPDVFRDLQDETSDEGRLPLSINFRSQPEVLDFANHVFGQTFGDRYLRLTAARPQVTATPTTELLLTAPQEEKATAENKRQAEARAIAHRLRELLDSEAPLVADEQNKGATRPVRAGDMALLFQSLSDVHLYEQALREQQIEYYLVGGHAFYSQQEVYDVLHLLKSIVSGCDEVSLAGVLRSPMFALQDETLYWLVRRFGSLNGALADGRPLANVSAGENAKLLRARQTLAELRAMKGQVATAEILQRAIERTGYDAALLAEFLGERKQANLAKLIEQARTSDAASPLGGGDLERFVRQLEEFTLRQPKEALASTSSEGADVVRLMTVHRAKGLEFPLVVLPDLNRRRQADRRSAAFASELGPLVKPQIDQGQGGYGLDLLKRLEAPEERAESLRKFYVACTRAADYLILSAVGEENAEPEGDWLKTVAARYDLATGQPTGEGPRLRIVTGEASLATSNSGGRRPDRLRMIDQARANLGTSDQGGSPIGPISLQPESWQQFSVSRLTGQLHQGRERPESIALQAALRADRQPIDPQGFGTLVHAVIERLPPQPTIDRQRIESLCLELAPLNLRRGIDRAVQEATDVVHQFTDSSAWQAMVTSPRLEREVEFILPWPPDRQAETPSTAWLRGYIDALVQDSTGRWQVVDYKTNRVTADGVQQAAESYRLQLGVYALAVEQVVGQPPAGMRLCFLRPGVVVDFAWDAAIRDETCRLVDKAIARVRAEVSQ